MEGALERWCVTFLGSAPASELFRTGHLSEVVAVALADGREVIIKIRAPSRRLAASVQVQRHLHSRGYPCPDVLAGPEPFGELMTTAETHVPAHGTPPEPPPPEPTAQLLAALVDSAPPANDFPALNPAPPWVGWDHPGESLQISLVAPRTRSKRSLNRSLTHPSLPPPCPVGWVHLRAAASFSGREGSWPT